MKSHIDIFRHISDKSVKYNNYITSRVQLPTRNDNIEWTKTIGYIFDFSYQGINGYLTIVDYQLPITLYFTIDNSDVIYEIGKGAFLKVGFRDIFKIHYYNYNVGDIVKNKEILGFTYNGKSIFYQYKCLNDGYIGNIQQSNISRNTGVCPVCMNHKVMAGINDIPTTDPWMISYFQGGYEEAKLYVASSNEYKELQCPYCGKLKRMAISTLYKTKSFSCECSDKIPYPEKCMINFLTALNIDYTYQCGNNTLSWIEGKYHYDFYVPSLNMIIETHGAQHYKELSKKSKWTSLEIIQERDLYKESLAMFNNIKYYIILNCSESNIEYLKNSIMNSELPALLKFEECDIDWVKIDQLNTRNIVKEICVYKNEHPYLTPTELAKKFNINKATLRNYCMIGEKFGWCTYNKEEIRWVANFHRNTHYYIDGHYFYNGEDVEARSEEVLGWMICGSAIRNFISSHPKGGLFKWTFEVRPLTHKEYLTENKEYPPFITERIIRGLQEKYT